MGKIKKNVKEIKKNEFVKIYLKNEF